VVYWVTFGLLCAVTAGLIAGFLLMSKSVVARTWGPLPMTDIVGRVYGVSGSNGRYSLKTPETFIADGLAPADHRVPLPLALALAGVVALVAAIVQGTVGTIRWAIRRRRRKRLRRPRSPSVSRPG
jgi:hypothetical protein